jgi:hypothetical protein
MFPSTFRRLEVFIAVVEAGGFIAGAERLGISHPSISKHVKALERQVGWFVRRKRLTIASPCKKIFAEPLENFPVLPNFFGVATTAIGMPSGSRH